MSRAAQEMQRIADEIAKARRQPTAKKGRQDVAHDNEELEDVTESEAHDEHRATGTPVDEAQPPAAAAAQEAPVAKKAKKAKAKSPSAIRSAKWRANQKKKNGGGAPTATDKASVKAQGKDDVKTVFVTTTVIVARLAFEALLRESQQQSDEYNAQRGVSVPDLQRIIGRLGGQ